MGNGTSVRLHPPPTFSQNSSSKSKIFKFSNFHNEASTMKKVVIKVCMNDDTSRFCCFSLRSSRSKALKVVGGFQGVQSVALTGDKDRIEVTGIFDSVNLINLLRKKVGYAKIVTESEAGAKAKKASTSKDKPGETKGAPPVICPCPRPEIVIGDSYPERGCWF